MSLVDKLKAFVDPNLPEVLKKKIPEVEYVEEENPSKTREKLAKRQGMLDIVAVLEAMIREQERDK
jgi:hypothetical protein